jgi:hypothetical protein
VCGDRFVSRVGVGALLLALLAGCGASPEDPAAGDLDAPVVLAGARSSHYGIRPFPPPEEWVGALDEIRGRFPGSAPVAIWIVGGLYEREGCRLEFPGDGRTVDGVAFLDHDKHEPYLEAFDEAGVQVYLQVEPGLADPEALIDLVMSRYGHHPSVVGFGVDVEWYRESERPGWGMKVDDETARRWEARVRAHDREYRLFLKNWDPRWMPPSHRGDIVFVDDSQDLAGLDVMVDEFAVWAETFAPNDVIYQVGYRSDRPWWGALVDPIADVGTAICSRVSQPCGIAWVDFTLREVMPAGVLSPVGGARTRGTRSPGADGNEGEPLVGVKIYEPVPDTEALFRDWRRLGINTAFVSTALAESGTFIPAAREAGFRTLVITPVFFNPEYLAARPDAWAVTGRGERAKDDWVEFVCPSREDYRQERAQYVLGLLREHHPDGLSLDFIRHFVFWERVKPGDSIEPLDTACYCGHCLARFQKEEGIELPEEVAAVPARAAEWLWARQSEAWARWRAGLVTKWVDEVAAEARRIAPEVAVGVHLVPWGPDEYDGGLVRVAGQDVEALASLVDYLSPMAYAHMLHREPEWVGEVTRELAARVDVPVYPSIEVKESYRSEELTGEFFQAALAAALRPPSRGVVFWSWPPLAEQEAKQEILGHRGS